MSLNAYSRSRPRTVNRSSATVELLFDLSCLGSHPGGVLGVASMCDGVVGAPYGLDQRHVEDPVLRLVRAAADDPRVLLATYHELTTVWGVPVPGIHRPLGGHAFD